MSQKDPMLFRCWMILHLGMCFLLHTNVDGTGLTISDKNHVSTRIDVLV